MKNTKLIGLALLMAASSQAMALGQGETLVNGFGSVGFTHLGGEHVSHGYGIKGQTTDSWRGDQLSKFGGQLQYGVTDDVTATVQVKASAVQDEWKPELSMAYLSWKATDGLTLRGGRLPLPIYMFSDTLAIGQSYPWLRLPDEVYSMVQASSNEGIDAIYKVPLSFGAVSYQAGIGQSHNRKNFSNDELFDVDYDSTAYANILLETNDYGSFRYSYAQSNLTLTVEKDIVTPFGPRHQVFGDYDRTTGKFLSMGYSYDNGTWVANAEKVALLVEGMPRTDSFYVMGGHRFGNVMPHATYAESEVAGGHTRSMAYGLNYTVSPKVVIKGEYKKVSTYNAFRGNFAKDSQELVDNALNAQNSHFGTPATNLDGDIFSVGVDFVF
jgi:hypothetical protein